MVGPTFDEMQLNIQGVTSIVASVSQIDPNSNQYMRTIQVFNKDASGAPVSVLLLTLYGGNQTTGDQSEILIQIPTISTD